MVHLRKQRRRNTSPVFFGCESFALVGDTAWVRASGELDLASAPVLAKSLQAAADTTLPVVVDLERLEFMDCAGVRVLVDAASRARRDGRRLRVVGASPAVGRVFTLTHTADLVGIDAV